MRLNWNNLGKGLEAIADAKIARDVAKAGNSVPGVTEGAYGSGLQDNIQQLQGLQGRAAQGASYNTGGSEDAIAAAEQQYNPALEELQRRSALTQADYSVGGSPNYATRERAMAEQGLMRSQREAEAYRSFGMADKANEVEGLALNRKVQLTQEERAAVAAGREDELYPLKKRAAEQVVNKGAREEKDAQARATFSEWNAANPGSSMEEQVAKAQTFGMSTTDINTEISNATGIATNVLEANALKLKQLVQGKNLDQLLKEHQSNEILDPGSHFIKIVGKGGRVSLQRVDTKTLEPMGGSVYSGTEDQALAYLNRMATNPATVAAFTMDQAAAERAVLKDEADMARIRAQTTLYGAQAAEVGKPKRATQANVLAYAKMLMTPDAEGRPQINPATLKPYTVTEARAAAEVELGGESVRASGPPEVDYAALIAAKENPKGGTKTGVVSAGNIATQVGDRQAAKAEETRMQGLTAKAAQESEAFAAAASLEGIDQLTPAVIAETSRSQVAQIYNSPMFKAMSRDQKVAVMRRMQNMPPVASGGLR
jgi:hypothetical protein